MLALFLPQGGLVDNLGTLVRRSKGAARRLKAQGRGPHPESVILRIDPLSKYACTTRSSEHPFDKLYLVS